MIELNVLNDYVIPLETFMPTGDGFIPLETFMPNSGGFIPSGTKQVTITENGTTTENVYSYADAEITVNVSGGAIINNQDKTVSPSTSAQQVTYDSGYTGLGTVTVEAMPSGTEGTPVATKGAVSNHAVDVTPSVTNTEGYIAGGTKTGTSVRVSASELVSGTKSITENGTEDVTNYASVNVNVPNSYDASDEGKVVSNCALVAQGSQTITENGTYDTTLVDDVTVNVSGGGGDDVLNSILDGTLAGRFETTASLIRTNILASLNGLTALFSSNATTVDTWAVSRCSNLETAVLLECKIVGSSAFRECPKFKAVDVSWNGNTRGSINNQCFMNDSLFDTIIIRDTMMWRALNNMNVFQSTPFWSDGSGGTVYVPQALISSYQSATNWSTILGYANNQILPIEGSIYETQYADGTPIS